MYRTQVLKVLDDGVPQQQANGSIEMSGGKKKSPGKGVPSASAVFPGAVSHLSNGFSPAGANADDDEDWQEVSYSDDYLY